MIQLEYQITGIWINAFEYAYLNFETQPTYSRNILDWKWLNVSYVIMEKHIQLYTNQTFLGSLKILEDSKREWVVTIFL